MADVIIKWIFLNLSILEFELEKSKNIYSFIFEFGARTIIFAMQK